MEKAGPMLNKPQNAGGDPGMVPVTLYNVAFEEGTILHASGAVYVLPAPGKAFHVPARHAKQLLALHRANGLSRTPVKAPPGYRLVKEDEPVEFQVPAGYKLVPVDEPKTEADQPIEQSEEKVDETLMVTNENDAPESVAESDESKETRGRRRTKS